VARPVSPTVRRMELARTLRQLRMQSGLTLDEAAHHIEVSAATLSRIETGIRIPRARDVRDLVQLYGVTDERRLARIVGLVAEAREQGWWEAYTEVYEEYGVYIGFEAAASHIAEYQDDVIPSLLQTPEYTRAYLNAIGPGRITPYSDHDIMKFVEIRTRRQQQLSSSLTYSGIIDEAAIQRLVGGWEVMNGQLKRLVELASAAGIIIRLLPFTAGAHPGQQGNFSILTIPQENVPDVVYVESTAGEIFVDGPNEVARYRRVWQALEKISLGTEETIEALKSKAADLQ
jgi:transcriptional regulator with XRE-family HTH domain